MARPVFGWVVLSFLEYNMGNMPPKRYCPCKTKKGYPCQGAATHRYGNEWYCGAHRPRRPYVDGEAPENDLEILADELLRVAEKRRKRRQKPTEPLRLPPVFTTVHPGTGGKPPWDAEKFR